MLQTILSRLHIRLLLLILIAVAPAFGIIVYTSVEQRAKVQSDARVQALSSARSLAARERDFVVHTQQLLGNLARSGEVRGLSSNADCNAFLGEVSLLHQDYVDLFVAGADGAVRCSANPAKRLPNVVARAYFQRALNGRDFAIGEFEISRISGKPAVMFGQPLFDDDGRVVAVLAAGLDPRFFDTYLGDLPLPPGSVLTLVDGKGTVLARVPNPVNAVGQPIPELPQFTALVAKNEAGTLESRWLDGVRRISAVAPVYGGGAGAGDIYVRVGIPADFAFADVGQAYYRNLILLSIAALATLALGWFVSERLVLRRVDDLVATAKRLGAGDLGARTRLAPDHTELGELARTLDEMAAGIELQQARIEQVKQELHRSNRALHAIRDCETVIADAVDERALLQGICDVVTATGYRMAWAGVMAADGSGAVVPAGITGEHQDYLACIAEPLRDGIRGMASIGEALRTCRPVVVNSFKRDVRLSDWRGDAAERGFNSKIALPLVQDDAAIGVLNVYAAEQDAFDAKEVDLLIGLAQGVTIAIQSHRHRSGRQAAEAALHLRNRAIEASNNGMLIVQSGEDPLVISVNAALMEIVGGHTEAFLGHDLARLGGCGFDGAGWNQLTELIRAQREDNLSLSLTEHSGHRRWFDVCVALVNDEAGELRHAAAEFRDVTESHHYQQQIEHQANYDQLTDLPNWNLLADRLRTALEQSAREASPIFVLWLDLDRFQIINDTLGRQVADQVLRALAQRLISSARGRMTVARAESDEFVLIADAATSHQAIVSLVGRIQQAVREPLEIDGQELILTASIGIAVAPDDGTEVDTLLRNASIAMYRAKETERGSFCFYAEDMNARAMPRLRMEVGLRQAVERDELFLVYQPKVDLRTGVITGAEALIRWQHPEMGLISPAEFIPIAEESGLILPIGQWVLETACAQIRQWQDQGVGPQTIAVNVSPIQFFRSDVVGEVRHLLDKYRLDPRLLMVEITESTLMRDTDRAAQMMHQLKALGIKLAIDDFGTGYSSLSALKRFPIDYLKIDQSFVANLTTDASDAAIAVAVISLAHSLGLRVIAEGVETPAQLEYLRGRDCDEMQGYFFSRPIQASQMEALMRDVDKIALLQSERRRTDRRRGE
jgi:diguanylate cyclase (GGDEF)-like protein